MKKITLFAFSIITAFTFSSCDKNDETVEETPKDPIVAKWDLKLVDIKISIDNEVVNEENDLDISGELTMQFDFKEDNTIHLYQYAPATEETEAQEFNSSGTYTKVGNQLTITLDGEDQTFTILSNDASNLHLFMATESEIQGMEIKQDITYKMIKM